MVSEVNEGEPLSRLVLSPHLTPRAALSVLSWDLGSLKKFTQSWPGSLNVRPTGTNCLTNFISKQGARSSEILRLLTQPLSSVVPDIIRGVGTGG